MAIQHHPRWARPLQSSQNLPSGALRHPRKMGRNHPLLMLTEARDEDAKRYKPDTAEHVRTALEYLTESNLLEDTQCPLTQTERKIFNQK